MSDASTGGEGAGHDRRSRRSTAFRVMVSRVLRAAQASRFPFRRILEDGALRRMLPNESQHLFALTLAVGAVCGVVAVAFHSAIRFAERHLIERALSASGSSWIAWTVASPTLGGLVVGAALHLVVPGARGSGVPQVKHAFAEGGRIRLRDAVGKFVLSTLQIGSGASLGREGPTVQICAGATSFLARATALPPRQLRRLMPVGVAAGIAAAFNAPIAAVTFTIEEIVGRLDHAVLSGVVIAAALAAVIERSILGTHPVLEVHRSYALDDPASLLLYAAMGVGAALVSVAFTDGLLRLRLAFRRAWLIPEWCKPAVGGLLTGLLALVGIRLVGSTGIAGGGYEALARALDGGLALRTLVVLGSLKALATMCSYSSGGAGGIFAPTLFIGAMLGGAIGQLDVVAFGHAEREIGAFALVGMGAVFAGIVRAPITSILIIFELTGGYGLVLPLMLANMTSYLIARKLRPVPVYEALLAQDGIVLPPLHAATNPLELIHVADAMTREVVSVRVRQSLASCAEAVDGCAFASVPVLGAHDEPVGVVSLAALRQSPCDDAAVEGLMSGIVSIPSDASLVRAAFRMNEANVRQLFVVDSEAQSRLVGVLSMSDLLRAHVGAASVVGDTSRTPLPSRSALLGSVMHPVVEVNRGARVTELLRNEAMATSVFVVRDDDNGVSIVPTERIRDFAQDDAVADLVVASDLALAARSVPASADVGTLVGAMKTASAPGVVVIDPASGAIIGVVTRADFANAFLNWYGHRAARDAARASTPP